MRGYIFTDWERERINQYLEDGTKLEGFPIVKTRMLDNLPKLIQDIKLGTMLWNSLQNEVSVNLRDFALEAHLWYLKHLKETNNEIPEIVIDDVQQALISKNVIYQAALENTYCGIIILNPENEILYVNRAMTEIAGRSKNKMIGKKPDIFLPAKEGYIQWLTKQVIEKGRFKHTVYTEEYDKWIEIEAATIIQEGEHIASVACVRDVTINKNMEQQVKELLQQLISHN